MARVHIAFFACLSLTLASAAVAQAPGADGPRVGNGHYQCSIGVTRFNSNDTHVLSARMKSAEACKSWGSDVIHLDNLADGYQLQVHDGDGKLVLKQVCRVKGVPLFGNGNSTFTCQDAH
jgi:hypothetical protein